MTATGITKGHTIYYDGTKWCWVDSEEGLDPVPEMIPCAHCGLESRQYEPDPCLGVLPGVANACCGHGNSKDAYVQFLNGVIIRGFDRLDHVDPVRIIRDWTEDDA